MADSYGYITPTNGFTVEVWFKRNAAGPDYQTLFNQRTQASVSWPVGLNSIGRQIVLEMKTVTGELQFSLVNESATAGTIVASWVDTNSPTYASDNEWHHVAFRVAADKVTWTLFLDGASYASGTASAPLNWNPGIATFGAQYDPVVGDWGSFIWNKWLAYPTLFQTAISDNRIFEHYTAGAGGTVYYGDDEVTRLNRIANWAEVPDQSREFETALINLQGIQVDGTNALTAFQDTSEAGAGLVFADGQSRLVYHNRRHRYNRWNVMTFAESLGSAPEVGMTFTIDDSNIYNDIRGDRPYGSTVRIQNALSKAAHGRKTYSFTIPVTTHEELRNAVAWIASQYGSPTVRISEVTFQAETSTDIEWAATGGVTIGDHITISELPDEAAPQPTMEFVVEKVAISANLKAKTWALKLQLSPFELDKVFQVGVSTLGDAYKIAY